MNILINGEPLDFTLENEKSVIEIIDNIEKWLNQQNFYISELFINHKEYYLHQLEELEDISFLEVEIIEMKALSLKEQQVKDLEILQDYFSLFNDGLSQNNDSVMTQLAEEFDNIKENLPRALQLDPYLFQTHLYKIMEESGILSGNIRDEYRSRLTQEWKNIQQLLEGRKAEIMDPVKEAKRSIKTLLMMKSQLLEVPLKFQQGQDKEALDLIIVMSEMFSRIFRIFSKMDDSILHKKELQDYVDSMSDILRELSDAIESQDTILMGDLVEYEILERLDILPNLIVEGD